MCELHIESVKDLVPLCPFCPGFYFLELVESKYCAKKVNKHYGVAPGPAFFQEIFFLNSTTFFIHTLDPYSNRHIHLMHLYALIGTAKIQYSQNMVLKRPIAVRKWPYE